jgi:hypothetical protein
MERYYADGNERKAPVPYAITAARDPNAQRDGDKIMVPRHNPRLPLRCVKTNLPVHEAQAAERSLYWCTAFVAFGLILSAPGLLILYLILRKRADVGIPLSEEGRKMVRNNILIATGVFVAGLMLLFVPAFAAVRLLLFVPITQTSVLSTAGSCSMILGVLAMVGGFIFALRKGAPLRITGITDNYVWLDGGSPQYLASLPVKA